MVPFKATMLRLAEQLKPTLPESTAAIVRAALEPVVKAMPVVPTTAWSTCTAPPGVLPSLAALRGGRGQAAGRPVPPVPDGAAFVTRSLTTPAGVARFKLFQPGRPTPPDALLVMLHGCTQDADDFAAGTAMNALAQAENMVVVYPEQSRSANMSRCWNWFLPQNQSRDGGEAALIAAVTRTVMAEHAIVPGRVFVAGLSAGGAMAAIVAEAYPDLFGAVGIHSGLAVGAAHDMASAFAAMRGGSSAAPHETGPLAAGVPTIVFHGDADTTVNSSNAAAIVARVTARQDGLRPVSETGTADGGRSYTRTVGRDATGRVRFESWSVAGAGHAWSGGDPAGSYTDRAGPDASAAMVRFFKEQIEPVSA